MTKPITSILFVGGHVSLASVLVFAGILKLTSYADFCAGLSAYITLPSFLINPLGALIISFEIAVGVYLLTTNYDINGAKFLVMIYLVFTVVSILSFIRDRGGYAPCNCFPGVGEALESKTPVDHLKINAVFIAVAVANLFLVRGKKCV